MEEVQSWWEVPAVAHFCYVFRSAFNLIFFEIAELESALLNIQDPDMSISLDQLIVRLLQGCYDDDEEAVNDENWEEKLHELFNENCEDDENLFNDTQYFMHLTPRSKIEILHRLCEFRLEVDGALEAIKNIPSEEMQGKCMGKDSQNNTYWYFCDERLYKENPNALKLIQTQKKEGKNAPNKSSKQVNTREKRTKAKPDVDKAWSITCYNISDWEKIMNTFTKSKSTHEKELASAIKNHLPILQERVAEKDRLLRKRFMELAPKRTSSRISKVQEMKKIEDMKAQEEARKAQLQAERERARIEAKKLKEEKESRQKRAEMRHKAIEERAKRAQLRERVRDTSDDDSDYGDEDSSNDEYSEQNQKTATRERRKVVNGNTRRNLKNGLKTIEESEEEDDDDDDDDDENEDDDRHNSDNDYQASSRRTNNRPKRTKPSYKKTVEPTIDNSRRYQRTYSGTRKQQDNGQLRVSSRLQNNSKTAKYKFESEESEQESDEAPSRKKGNGIQTRLQQNRTKEMDQSNSEESADENDSDSDDSRSDEVESKDNCRRLPIQKTFTVTKSSLAANDSSISQGVRNPNVPKVTLYKSNLLNSSGTSNWTLDSKAQKLHILHSTFDNLSPKRLKLDEGKSTASSTLKSSLSKENHMFKVVQRTPAPFITYGRIIPTKPAIVRLDFRKPPNPPVSRS